MEYDPFVTSYIDQRLSRSDGVSFDYNNIGDFDTVDTSKANFSLTTANAASVYARVTGKLSAYSAPPTLPIYSVEYGNNTAALTPIYQFVNGVIPFHVKVASELESTVQIDDTLSVTKATGTGLSVTSDATIGGIVSITKATGTNLVVTAGSQFNGTMTLADGSTHTAIKTSLGVTDITGVATFTSSATHQGSLTVWASSDLTLNRDMFIAGNTYHTLGSFSWRDGTSAPGIIMGDLTRVIDAYTLNVGNNTAPVTFEKTANLYMYVGDAGKYHRRLTKMTDATTVVVEDYIGATAVTSFDASAFTINDRLYVLAPNDVSFMGIDVNNTNGAIADCDGLALSPNTSSSNKTRLSFFKISSGTFITYNTSFDIPSDGGEMYYQTLSRVYANIGVTTNRPGLSITTSSANLPYPHMLYRETGGIDIFDQSMNLLDRNAVATTFDHIFDFNTTKGDSDANIKSTLRLHESSGVPLGGPDYTTTIPGASLAVGAANAGAIHASRLTFDRGNTGFGFIMNNGNVSITYKSQAIAVDNFILGLEAASSFTPYLTFSSVSGIVSTVNMTAIAPSTDYHVSTKKYVDDVAAPLQAFKTTHEPTLNNFSYEISALNPTLLDEYDPGGNSAMGAVVSDGSYYYISTAGSGLAILDVSNTSSIVYIGMFDPVTPASFDDVALKGVRLFAAGGGSGLAIIDISDRANPSYITSVDRQGACDFVRVIGNYLYINAGQEIDVYDILVESSYNRIFPPIGLEATNYVDVDATPIAYVENGNLGVVFAGGGGMMLLDVTIKTAIVHYGGGYGSVETRTDEGGSYQDGVFATISGTLYLFVAITGTVSTQGIRVYDMTTPGASMTSVNHVTSVDAESLVIVQSGSDYHLLVGAGNLGLYSYNVTDPLNFVLNSSQDNGSVRFMELAGTVLYACGISGAELYDVGAKVIVTRLNISSTDTRALEVMGGARINKNLEIIGISHDVINDEQNTPTGVLDRTESNLSFVNGTRTFSITQAVTSFTIYADSRRYVFTAAENIVISDTEGMHYIYFAGGGIIQSQTTEPSRKANIVEIYWDKENQQEILIVDNRHSPAIPQEIQDFVHAFHGLGYGDGLAIGNVTFGDGSLDSHLQFSVSNGSLWDEDIKYSILNGLPQVLSPIAEIPVFYRSYYSAAVVWRRSPTGVTIPVLGAPAGRVYYNRFNNPDWVLQEATNGYFVNYFVHGSGDINSPISIFMGISEYSTSLSARDGVISEIESISAALTMHEFICIAAFVVQTSNSYINTRKGRIITTGLNNGWFDFRTAKSGQHVYGMNHDVLSGRGNDSHIQYPLLTGRTGDTLLIDNIGEFTGSFGTTFNHDLIASAATASTSTATGGLRVSGGLGVIGSAHIGSVYTNTILPTTAATINFNTGASSITNLGPADNTGTVNLYGTTHVRSGLFQTGMTGNVNLGEAGFTLDGTQLVKFAANSLVGAHNETMAWLDTHNGLILEDFTLAITSDGATITATLNGSVSDELHLKFTTGTVTVSTNPDITTTVTPGTATVPQENWIYIRAATPTTLTVNTTGFPTTEDFVPLTRVYVQTAVLVQSNGVLKQHNYTDHADDSYDQGHIYHMARWIRSQHATYESGITLTITGSGTGTVEFSSTSGVIDQLHPHTFPAFTSPATMYVVNDNTTPYTTIANLHNISTDSTGTTLDNTTFAVVMWGVINQGNTGVLFVNLPAGGYNNAVDARADSSAYTDFSIPLSFRGVGFLIRRFILTRNVGGTTTTVDGGDTGGTGDNLLGVLPNSSGGTTVSAIASTPEDSTFRITNTADATKKIAFSAGSITTGTTRTLTMSDFDLDLGTPVFVTLAATTNTTTPIIYSQTGTGGTLTLRSNATDITTGSTTVPMSTASTSTSTGAFVVTGGVGIGGAIFVGGLLTLSDQLDLGGQKVGRWTAATPTASTNVTSIDTNTRCRYTVIDKTVTISFDLIFTVTTAGATAVININTGIASNGAPGLYANGLMFRNTSSGAYNIGQVEITSGAATNIPVTFRGSFITGGQYQAAGEVRYERP